MWRCRHCDEIVDEEEGGEKPARCPYCDEPLFERAGGPQIVAGAEVPERGLCAIHPRNVASGHCRRCGNFFCPVCRTRWEDRMLCLSCVERLIGQELPASREELSHKRSAVVGLVCGIGAWACIVVAGGLAISVATGAAFMGLAVLAGLLVPLSLVLATVGVGQSANAIRLRGARMFMATAGLVLSATCVGSFVGLMIAGVLRGAA